MLTLAVGLTLVGFVLLVIALMKANFILAVVCIVVCVVGLLVLLYDTLRANKQGRGGVDDEPLFTIRGRESATRAEPLIDGSDEATAAEVAPPDVAEVGDPQTPAAGAPIGGLGSIVSPDAHGAPVGETSTPQPTAEQTGDANDYIRSVTGSFPAQTPTGPNPTGTTELGETAAAPVGDVWAPASGSFQAGGFTPGGVDSPDPIAHSDAQTAASSTEDATPDSAGYVGRRRRIEQSENLVVNTSDPTLPAMQFVFRDTDGETGGAENSGAENSGDTGGSADQPTHGAPSTDETDTR